MYNHFMDQTQNMTALRVLATTRRPAVYGLAGAARSNIPAAWSAFSLTAPVQFFGDSIDLAVWQGLATRKGNESISY